MNKKSYKKGKENKERKERNKGEENRTKLLEKGLREKNRWLWERWGDRRKYWNTSYTHNIYTCKCGGERRRGRERGITCVNFHNCTVSVWGVSVNSRNSYGVNVVIFRRYKRDRVSIQRGRTS